MKNSVIKKLYFCWFAIFTIVFLNACAGSSKKEDRYKAVQVIEGGSYPNIYQHNGNYYLLTQPTDANIIKLYTSSSLDSIGTGSPVAIWDPNSHGMSHVWAPEMLRVDDKWLVYFEADDGNTDNHQLYVIENPNEDPTSGEWTLHGPIITDEEWNFGIHPSSFIVNGKQYLLWSGWEHRRAEIETQCIFIAEMANPWTLKSERVLLSRPEFEWERQWINPNGSRSAYPIFVNENPVGFISADGKKIIVGYSASGIWTPFATLGILYADADSDLLNSSNWTKMPDPQTDTNIDKGEMVGISNITVVNSQDSDKYYILYQAHKFDGESKYPGIYLSEFTWNSNSLPDFKALGQ